MKIIEQRTRSRELIEKLLEVWENSVRETHLFLSDEEIKDIKEYVPLALEGVEDLFVLYSKEETLVAFMGTEKGSLEMLFISPEERGKGYGRKLTEYGIQNLGVSKVAVNEQNPQAKGFYEHMGFEVYKREEKDEQGGDYPLLYMELRK